MQFKMCSGGESLNKFLAALFIAIKAPCHEVIAAILTQQAAFHHVDPAGFCHKMIAIFQKAVAGRVGHAPVSTESNAVKLNQPMFKIGWQV